MAKIYGFIMLAISLMVLFYIAGIGDVTTSFIFEKILGFDNSTGHIVFHWQNLMIVGAVVTLFTAGALNKISIFGVSVSTINIAKAGFISTLYLLGQDFYYVLSQLDSSSWVFWVVGMFMLPILGGFLWSLVEWWNTE